MEIFDKIENMLKEKEKQISTQIELEYIEIIKEMLDNKATFFEVDMETVVGMLYFLGVKKEDLEKTYYELVSPENYCNIFPRQRQGISNNI